MQIRVYYEDTDAGGIVYHTNYIKYCERARSEAFFEQGMMPNEDERSGFIVKHLKCDFFSSAKLGDLLEVKTSILQLKDSYILLLQEVFRDRTKVFSMEIQLVYVKATKPTRMPEKFRELFVKLM